MRNLTGIVQLSLLTLPTCHEPNGFHFSDCVITLGIDNSTINSAASANQPNKKNPKLFVKQKNMSKLSTLFTITVLLSLVLTYAARPEPTLAGDSLTTTPNGVRPIFSSCVPFLLIFCCKI